MIAQNKQEYGRNKRPIRLTYNGQTKTIIEWSRITGIKSRTLFNRYKAKWSTKRILTQPVQKTCSFIPDEDLKYHPVYVFIIRYKLLHDGNSPSTNLIAKSLQENNQYVRYWIERMMEAGLVGYDKDKNLRVYGGKWLPPREELIDELFK